MRSLLQIGGVAAERSGIIIGKAQPYRIAEQLSREREQAYERAS
jgi:hypothetical protein